MLKQYQAIKSQHRDSILFFRLGDFYEMFLDDAKVASKELELTLTGRGKDENRIAMCGVPFHAADGYILKLINKGYKVAVCEQVEDPALAKGLTRREVVRVVTPGTVMGVGHLEEAEQNYLLAMGNGGDHGGRPYAYVDASTGEFRIGVGDASWIQARETIEAEGISEDQAEEELKRHFGVQSLSAFGIEDYRAAYPAAWAILRYLKETQKHHLPQITRLLPYRSRDSLYMDPTTIRNLELVEKTGSLFWVLDATKTAMGARRLKQLIRHPFIDDVMINQRLDAVEALIGDLLSREEIREILGQVYDLERLLSRIVSGHHNPRDVVALRDSLRALKEMGGVLDAFGSSLSQGERVIREFDFGVLDVLDRGIVDDPAPHLRDGGYIKSGFSEELDQLNLSFKTIREWIAGLEDVERQRTGIKSLKVGFNKVFGYYFTIPNAQQDKVPADYIRKQTLVGAERYITPELKEKESILLHGEEKQIELEAEIYLEIVAEIQKVIPDLQELARVVADLDCLQSLATVSQRNRYCRPRFAPGLKLEIKNGRHPVLEKKSGMSYIPNDIHFKDIRFALITGPNMAGKSTLMRQIALTVVMAQMGCFVPADSATLSMVDKLFTRIGAMDNLYLGQSTFMVEMLETAAILNQATSQSLIILDEIGRGTSTFDGMSIAYAVSEHIHEKIGARTFFATHYHELSVLEERLKGFKNFSMKIREHNDRVIFDYKFIEGPADKSYGIHVAQMAGLPKSVVDRANQILEQFEAGEKQLRLF